MEKGRSKKDNCLDIQEKIFDIFEDDKIIDVDLALKNHISICHNCQNYIEKLSVIKKQMRIYSSTIIEPDPQILKNIIAYKDVKSGLKRKNQGSFWDTILAIFEFKIPVYQALSGAVVILMLFMYVSGTVISTNPRENYDDYTGNQQGIMSSEFSAFDSLADINPSRGQNAKEDSVLIGFLVPTM